MVRCFSSVFGPALFGVWKMFLWWVYGATHSLCKLHSTVLLVQNVFHMKSQNTNNNVAPWCNPSCSADARQTAAVWGLRTDLPTIQSPELSCLIGCAKEMIILNCRSNRSVEGRKNEATADMKATNIALRQHGSRPMMKYRLRRQ
jgi:hypothetical protein